MGRRWKEARVREHSVGKSVVAEQWGLSCGQCCMPVGARSGIERQTLLGQRGKSSEDTFSARLKRAHSLCIQGLRRGWNCVSSGQSVPGTGPDV